MRNNTQTQTVAQSGFFSVTCPPPQQQRLPVDDESSMAQSVVEFAHNQAPQYAVLVFEFDGCVTADARRYFQHWTRADCEALSMDHIISNVMGGSEQRLDALRSLFASSAQRTLKLYCVGHESTAVMQVVLRKMELRDYFETEAIVGSDHALLRSGSVDDSEHSDHTQMKLFLLRLLQQQHIENEQLLLVSANQENIDMCKQINLCSVYEVKSVDDITKMQQWLLPV